MNLEHGCDPAVRVALIAASEVPSDGEVELICRSEHDAIAKSQLLGREPAAERIVDVRIGAGLIEQHVAPFEGGHVGLETPEESLRLARIAVVLAVGDVLDPRARAELLDDLVGAVAVVHVGIEDANATCALCVQHGGGDHEAVERAEASTVTEACVVEAGARRAGDRTGGDRGSRCGEHRAGGVWEARGDARAAITEAVRTAELEHVSHVVRSVSAHELVDGHGHDRLDANRPTDRHASLEPTGHDRCGFACARRVAVRTGDHFGAEEHGDFVDSRFHTWNLSAARWSSHAGFCTYHDCIVMDENELLGTKGLSLERLQSLLLVHAAGGIARAAPGNATRQSQLSRQLGELETALGVPLTEKQGRTLVLTAAGRELATAARDLVDGLVRVRSRAEDAELRITIGAGDGVLSWWVVPALARMKHRARVTLVALSSDAVIERLALGEVDVGIVRRTEVPKPMRTRSIGAADEVLMVPRAKCKRGATAADVLANVPIAATTGEPGALAHAKSVLRRLGIEPKSMLECETFPMVCRAVATGEYAGWLPMRAREEAGDVAVFDDVGVARKGVGLAIAWTGRLDRRAGVGAWVEELCRMTAMR